MAFTNSKTCADCGAVNDANDLFCRDCGASLAMVTKNAEQTSTFTPVAPVDDTQTTAVAPAVIPHVAPATQYGYPASEPQPTYGTMPVQESARGAVLGWLAATLFLLIAGFFVWSSLLSDAARDRFTGIF